VAQSALNYIDHNTAGALTQSARDSQKEKHLISSVNPINFTVQFIVSRNEFVHLSNITGVAQEILELQDVIGVPNVPGKND
jgi:hypothetical protein